MALNKKLDNRFRYIKEKDKPGAGSVIITSPDMPVDMKTGDYWFKLEKSGSDNFITINIKTDNGFDVLLPRTKATNVEGLQELISAQTKRDINVIQESEASPISFIPSVSKDTVNIIELVNADDLRTIKILQKEDGVLSTVIFFNSSKDKQIIFSAEDAMLYQSEFEYPTLLIKENTFVEVSFYRFGGVILLLSSRELKYYE